MSDTQPRGHSSLKLTPGQVPAFTLEDMKVYLQSMPSCSAGPTLSGEPPIVETLEFVGCKELSNRLNLSIGLADDALVCYAVLGGPFQMKMMSLPPGAAAGIRVSERVEEIYDASTGQLLVWGVPSQRS